MLALPPWNYSVLMLLALAVSAVLFRATGRKLSLTPAQYGAIMLGAFSGSFIAARLPYLFEDVSALCSWQGWVGNGKTILFGLVGGYLGVELAKWCADVKVSTGDRFAVPVAIGIAIGRLACFNGGCCFGTPTSLPWGVTFADGIPRHPTQVYESLFHLVAAALMTYCLWRGLFKDRLIRLYFISYAGYRFLTEFIRPEPRIAFSLTWYQFIAAGLIVLFIVVDQVQTSRTTPAATES
ncbi:MAG: prolipoprotein diacylglyceryl transferase [Planctomycetaceae bacterium]|nr:prolipoprotein diacylglyceryl transferase [Planctomycetaceae bacterium]